MYEINLALRIAMDALSDREGHTNRKIKSILMSFETVHENILSQFNWSPRL